jgi:hypothetical protein
MGVRVCVCVWFILAWLVDKIANPAQSLPLCLVARRKGDEVFR